MCGQSVGALYNIFHMSNCPPWHNIAYLCWKCHKTPVSQPTNSWVFLFCMCWYWRHVSCEDVMFLYMFLHTPCCQKLILPCLLLNISSCSWFHVIHCHHKADERLDNPAPQSNQEPCWPRQGWIATGKIGVSKSMECNTFCLQTPLATGL